MVKCIGIRREDKNIWEKRSPLIPSHLRELSREHGLSFRVQPSSNRIFTDAEFSREGAELEENLGGCDMVLAIKEIPIPLIGHDKIYMFFSHTIKGQSRNMPMLKRMMANRCSLIEYERITDEAGRRLLFFGTQAGQAGMIETLHALGLRLGVERMAGPFGLIQQPYRYGSLLAAKEEIARVGGEIHNKGLDRRLSPLICGFAGYGNTSRGAQEIFDLLPVEEIAPADLRKFVESGSHSVSRVYKVVFKEEDMVIPRERGAPFNLQDYYDHPEKYRSVFDTHLPYLTLLINGIYWEPRFPRFVTTAGLKRLFQDGGKPRLRVIGDISCDIEGSIECTRFATTPEDPVFTCDPLTGKTRTGAHEPGVVIMSIDNLPAEIPRESSLFFSGALKPFVPEIAAADFSAPFDACVLPDPIKRAVVLYRGELTPEFAYLKEYLR